MFINECHSLGLEQCIEKRDLSKRILRPPNAFILYRSDFLKRRTIPPEVEKRQQNLSRIAGQCWNMLSDAEKAVWHSKAAIIRAEHRVKRPSRETEPLQKNNRRLSTNDTRKGSAIGHAFRRRSRPRQTRPYRSPYSEGMFAAIHDSKLTSPDSQASLLSPVPALETPLHTSTLLSPLSFPYLLPPFSSHSNWQDSPPASSKNPTIQRHEIGYLQHDPEAPQWDLTKRFGDLEITMNETGSSPDPFLTLGPDGFATCTLIHADLSTSGSYPDSQISPTPQSNTFTPSGYDFSVADNLAIFDRSWVPFYPSYNGDSNLSGQRG